MTRIGFGTDVHFFTDHPGRRLVLCGFPVAGHQGVEADSDGDVGIHALCNAISSAIGGKSMGFYVQELYNRGITDSAAYLKHILNRADEVGFRVSHISLSVECVTPRIDPLADGMKSVLAPLLGISESAIGITALQGDRQADRIRVSALAVLESQ